MGLNTKLIEATKRFKDDEQGSLNGMACLYVDYFGGGWSRLRLLNTEYVYTCLLYTSPSPRD